METSIYAYDANAYESDVLGAYRMGAFDIYLSGNFNANLSNLSTTDLGTFVHEYIHFIQNISTPWGIFAGIVRNNDIAEMVNSYENLSNIKLPYNFNPSDKQLERRKWLQCSIGTGHTRDIIDRNAPTSFCFEDVLGIPARIHRVHFFYTNIDGENKELIIGATIIKESMAVMIQSLVDTNLPQHYDVPYNVLDVLCGNHFKNIAGDKRKLIYLCYISLFSLDPGYTLLCELKKASLNPQKTGKEIFDEFLTSNVAQNGEHVEIMNFFNSIIEDYKASLRGILPCNLHFMEHVLSAVKMNQEYPPLITFLESETFDANYIQKLVDWLGIPFLHTADGTQFYPQHSQDNHFSQDVVILAGNAAMYDYLVGYYYGKTCPFSFMCDDGEFICDASPWKKCGCMFILGLASLRLDKKEIVITTRYD